jgi:hypothetical protein
VVFPKASANESSRRPKPTIALHFHLGKSLRFIDLLSFSDAHVVRLGYLPKIAKRYPETRIDSPSEPTVRLGRLRRWAAACAALVVAACAAAPAALASPPGSSGEAKAGSKGLVSARYQAVDCDTAATRGLATRSGAAMSPDPAVRSRIPATATGSDARESGRAQLQYRSRNAIPHSSQAVSLTIPTHQAPSAPGSCRRIAASIASTSFEASIRSDGRRLFQIAVAFALAYVVFLTVWFWGTRERRSRVGRAARS